METMLWFFEKERATLHYEIRHDPEGPGFELVVTYPDGRQRIERSGDARDLVERSGTLRSTLISEGWRSVGG